MAIAGDELDTLAHEVRLHVFGQAAETGQVPQPAQIALALGRDEPTIRQALRRLAEGRVLILAPNSESIWAANPFCAVPSGVRVETGERAYWAICIWDALGISAALSADARITAPCGASGETMTLEVRSGELVRHEGIIHFAVPAHRWWDNIGYT